MQTPTYCYEILVTVLQMSNVVCLILIVLQCIGLLCGLTAPKVTAMKKLKIAYNNGLRGLLNLPKYNSASEMFVNLYIPSFGELLCKFVFSFKSRIMNSDNLLVNGIVRFTTPLFSKIWA